MTSLQIDDRHFELPETWNECTPKQAMMAVATLSRDADDFDALRIELLISLLPDIWKLLRDIEPDELAVILERLDGFFETIEDTDPPQRVQAPTLTRCPYPIIELSGNRRLVTLRETFDDMTFQEWCAVSDLYTIYLAAPDAQRKGAAAHIMAVLFRPPTDDKYAVDPRRPLMYYEHMVKQRRVHLSQMIPTPMMNLLVFWVASCRTKMAQQYPRVFQATPSGKPMDNPYGWQGILLSLAEGPAADALENAGKTNVHNVLAWLDLQERNRG